MQWRLVLEELVLPYLLLRLPVDQVSFVDGAAEDDLSKVSTFRQLRSYIDLLLAISRHTVGYYGRRGSFGGGGREACFDGVCAIVDYEGAVWGRGARGLCSPVS